MKEALKEFFNKNPNTEKCYSTSDGNIFATEHYATNWARGLRKNDKVETHFKAGSEKPKAEGEKTDKTGAEGVKADTTTADTKESLTKRYVELFDKKPNVNLGLEKMKTQMAEAEAKLVEEIKSVFIETEEAKKEAEATETQTQTGETAE